MVFVRNVRNNIYRLFSVMRTIIIGVYLLLLILSICLMGVSFASLMGSPQAFDWSLFQLGFSFIPMVVFTGVLLRRQLLLPTFSGWYLFQCCIVGFSLLYMAGSHMYPEDRFIFAGLHLGFIILFLLRVPKRIGHFRLYQLDKG